MDEFEGFYNKALKFLSYRPRSEKEVKDKLKVQSEKLKVENSKVVIDRIIQKLKEKKFINDEEFAKGWIESRLRFKPRGLRLIELELKKKGISSETINNLQLTINDLEQAKKLVEKKMTRFRTPPRGLSSAEGEQFGMTREEIYQKLGRFLASKGFSWDTIKQAIDETLRKGV